MKNIKEFVPLVNLLKKEKWKFIFFSILIFLVQASSIFTGYLNGAAVEEITKLNLKKALLYLFVYFLYSVIIKGIISVVSGNELVKLETKLTRKIGYETYLKAINMPSYAYEEMSSGEVINRITNDADMLSFTFRRLIEALGEMFSAIILIFYIFYNSYIIGLEIIILMFVLFLIMKYFNPKMEKAHKERKKEKDNFTSLVNESIKGVREIKTLGIKNNLLAEMNEIIDSLYKKNVVEINYNIKFTIFTKIVRVLMEVLVFVSCAILLYYNNITLTFFIAMTYYVYHFTYLIDSLTDLIQTYQKVAVALSRINEILLNKKFDDEKFGKKTLKDIKGEIELKNVYFSYPGEENVLKNFNLKLEPNKKIAIVGKSGQGKSTLFNLLTRVFDVNEGEILIDGINIKDLTEDLFFIEQ